MAKKAKIIGKKKVGKFVYWTPRIVSIIFLLFLAIFSLDVFGNGYTFWETVVGLLMHNIPVFVLAIVLWISWKYEIVGAIAFILAGILYTISMLIGGRLVGYEILYSLIIAVPAFLIGILFWMNWKRKK